MSYIDKENVLHILGTKVLPGTGTTVNFNLAKLYTANAVEVPIVIERSHTRGPVVLITSGIHGDEINGVEIVRQLIAKKINKPKIGTVICVPVVNIFGFLDMKRAFPDGRDLNRVFPGNPRGSLASRFAYQFVKKILPVADFCMDFHTGGAARFNVAQVRIDPMDVVSTEYAAIFNAPFTIHSKIISKSYRATCSRLGKPILLFEGGKSKVSDKEIARVGVHGAMRVLKHLGLLNTNLTILEPQNASILIEKTKWHRASHSGLLHTRVACGEFITKEQHIATITDPYGKQRHIVKAKDDGYVINVNEASLVYQGDAIFNISVPSQTNEQAGTKK